MKEIGFLIRKVASLHNDNKDKNIEVDMHREDFAISMFSMYLNTDTEPEKLTAIFAVEKFEEDDEDPSLIEVNFSLGEHTNLDLDIFLNKSVNIINNKYNAYAMLLIMDSCDAKEFKDRVKDHDSTEHEKLICDRVIYAIYQKNDGGSEALIFQGNREGSKFFYGDDFLTKDLSDCPNFFEKTDAVELSIKERYLN